MALRIGTASQKGGVSKSAIARNLAVTFAANDYEVKVMDIDLDQSTCQDWALRRMANGHEPAIRVETFQNFTQALRAAGRDAADVFIFDGPAKANEGTVEMAKAVDLLLLPTCSGLDDMKPAVRLANKLVDQHGIEPEKIAFVLSRAGDSDKELVEARSFLGQTRFPLISGTLYEKTMYRLAYDAGLSAVEVSHKGLRDKADHVAQSIIELALKLSTHN